jgi:hypothetical protein
VFHERKAHQFTKDIYIKTKESSFDWQYMARKKLQLFSFLISFCTNIFPGVSYHISQI